MLPELKSAPIITFGDAPPLKLCAISLPAGAEQRQPQMTHIPISYSFLPGTSKDATFAARQKLLESSKLRGSRFIRIDALDVIHKG